MHFCLLFVFRLVVLLFMNLVDFYFCFLWLIEHGQFLIKNVGEMMTMNQVCLALVLVYYT
jgi:hypothetical protein